MTGQVCVQTLQENVSLNSHQDQDFKRNYLAKLKVALVPWTPQVQAKYYQYYKKNYLAKLKVALVPWTPQVQAK